MTDFLVLRLDGVMQAWGDHTYEDYRPVVNFPTRSGLLGLLAACLGIDRVDIEQLKQLDSSVEFTVRVDNQRHAKGHPLRVHKINDFHTVLAARKVNGKSNDNPVVSRREYLCDTVFTVVIGAHPQPSISLERLKEAVNRPIYTPFLGRRSCPLSRPLFLAWMKADSSQAVLAQLEPVGGRIYSESFDAEQKNVQMRVRDVPLRGQTRRFSSRQMAIHKEIKHVSQ
ncbi:MAG: type I-E CRISPR-associated protein Cas5/CasD [Agitococcus sp.]|jgi:CRISPR system Cascade subunit CasD|nr:type I-E CRISPR-associated protein Cas5/CasD [Agitococcus sp.]MBP8110766.1 type I-E CRISPR-associated protein Cas5/CasD [Agitococcus sp.]